ncbi:hypothetical protein ACJMK2_023027 [Sinanodonta woodiana]|uniref:Uncharacterized protein n=1 Tax=Sinanodonta woodiana TaxID=1069815 RepID=A0ABD3T462_SINWO
MTSICLVLISLAVCTYTTHAFIGTETGDLLMMQMLSGMLGGQQRGTQPAQGTGAGAEPGSQGQNPMTRRGGDLGLAPLMQMRLLSALMN